MIKVIDVHKRYMTDHGKGPWVLSGINIEFPRNVSVGLIGGNGAGKSTLLRIIGGSDTADRGTVERHCKVSWPMSNGGLQRSLSGRQNAKFICRIMGFEEELREKIEFIREFADIGSSFEEPVKTYSSGMRSRLEFAMSIAFNFDVYISDEVTSAGDGNFRKKAKEAFKGMIGRASVIMVSHNDNVLKQFCEAGVWLHRGQAYWFDSINDALKEYKGASRYDE